MIDCWLIQYRIQTFRFWGVGKGGGGGRAGDSHPLDKEGPGVQKTFFGPSGLGFV